MRISMWCAAGVLLLSSGSANAALIGYCHAAIGSDYYFTHVIELPENTEYVSIHKLFERFVEHRIGKTPRDARCDGFGTRQEAEEMHSQYLRNLAASATSTTFLSNFPPDPRQVDLNAKRPSSSGQTAKKPVSDETKVVEPQVDQQKARAAAHAAVEERNRAAQEKYEAELAEQKRKVEEFERAKGEVARKKAEQQAAAAQALAEHDAQRAAADQLLRRYDAEQRRRNACLAGDKQACADIVAGKPVGDTRLADANKGKASTDTDANQCVTSAELRLNDTFKGNTAAYVVNGCGQPVDVRVCLMTESGGWNCGSTAGLQPQGRWSYSSFNATGQVFVDAHTSGSGKPFASPN